MTVFGKIYLSIKAEIAKYNFEDNHFHNTLRLYDTLPIFRCTTSETFS